LFVFTTAWSEDDVNKVQQSARTMGIIRHFENMVKKNNEGIDNDLLVTNEKIAQLETTQIDTNSKLAGVELLVARMDKSLGSLLHRFDEVHAKMIEDGKKTDNQKDEKKDNKDKSFGDNGKTML
jgi:uncharacterized protein YjaZ